GMLRLDVPRVHCPRVRDDGLDGEVVCAALVVGHDALDEIRAGEHVGVEDHDDVAPGLAQTVVAGYRDAGNGPLPDQAQTRDAPVIAPHDLRRAVVGGVHHDDL